MNISRMLASIFLVVDLLAGTVLAVNIETVPVGNPGNAGDTEVMWDGTTGYGSVAYTYNIGKYEVTAGQYCEFLNKVAKTDTYGLYNTNMDTAAYSYGCNIKRTGTSGSYTYTVGDGSPTDVANWADRPVNLVSYWDACRFANWLHNGQPTGAQEAGTTETGAYTLIGYNGDDGRTIQRNAGWKWAVTSEDEWYKAAYHKHDGLTGNYFDYPTSNDAVPSNDLIDPDPGNNATFYDNGDAIGSPYYRTEVGAHENSDSPYGTFDQGGNVWEWNESVVYEEPGYALRGLRGGSFYNAYYDYLHASNRNGYYPTEEGRNIGFRVSEVPEPAGLLLLALGGLAVMRRRLRRIAVAVIPVTLVALLLSATSARANVFDMPAGLTSLETVPVGDPGAGKGDAALFGAGKGDAALFV